MDQSSRIAELDRFKRGDYQHSVRQRCRGARARHQRREPRVQLRHSVAPGRLYPPHRPHRPRGRTGRAFSFVPRMPKSVDNIEKLTGMKIAEMSLIVAERGRRPSPAARLAVGPVAVMSAGLPVSPGCWMLTKTVRPSGVESMPVISHSFGPTRKRRRLAPGAAPTRVAWVTLAAGDVLVTSWARRRRPCRARAEHHAVGHVGIGAVVGLDPHQRLDETAGVDWRANDMPSGRRKSLSAVRPES